MDLLNILYMQLYVGYWDKPPKHIITFTCTDAVGFMIINEHCD